MAVFHSIVTDVGATQLTQKIAAGEIINIDHAKAGKGTFSGNPQHVTDIVDEIDVDVRIISKRYDEMNNIMAITVQILNDTITTEQEVNELSLHNEDGTIFGYAWHISGGDNKLTVPEHAGFADTILTFEIGLFITNQENAQIQITFTFEGFVTIGSMQAYFQKVIPQYITPIDDRLSRHIGAGGITQHPLATQLTPGFSERNFTAENKNELENMPENIAKAVTTGRWAQFIASPFDLNILRAIGGE